MNEQLRKIIMFRKSWDSARVMIHGACKARFQLYKGECQKNIASVSRGRMYSESRRVSGIKNM